ncbi:uncharacterized protein [Watersipora subatra]|uniref:uncharacterized protein n=1 Tax=Watersipora subatra TaxID=2589382 RepID=UPI00355C1E44
MKSAGLIITVTFLCSVSVWGTEYSAQSCTENYYSYSHSHTACIRKEATPNGKVDWNSIGDEDRAEIVRVHNEYRGTVHLYNGGKKASDMLPMSYDRELENIAQIWAANCIFAHDEGNNRYIPGKYDVGQNLAIGTPDWKSTLDLWHSEVNYFVYGSPPPNLRSIGHYTQMVWAESTRVGCGVQVCNGTRKFYVCNYAPVGNMADRLYQPYKLGSVDEDCPQHYNLETGLCECPQSVCFNQGVVDTKSCTCNCRRAAWLQEDNCALMCGRAEDHPNCARWGTSYCSRYTNVKAEYCPHMCKVCPVEVGPARPPLPPTTQQTPSVFIGRITPHRLSTTSTEPPASLAMSYCEKEEPALCGQPNSKTSYLPPSVCLNKNTAGLCPAMCGLCIARTCRDYADNSYNIGESWINMYGRFTCTESGVQLEQGCQTEDRKDIVPLDASRFIKHENASYSCTCEAGDAVDDIQRLHCIPIEPEEPAKPVLETCDRAEGARCGLPNPQGRYWHRSHCTLRIVRKLCPAMCRLCAAKRCRMYNGTVVDVLTETNNNKNNLYVCTLNGWSIGPLITIDYNHTTQTSVHVQRHHSTNIVLPPSSAFSTSSIISTSVVSSTVAQTSRTITSSSTVSTGHSSTTGSTGSGTKPSLPPAAVTTVSARGIEEWINSALENDPYADDYLEDGELLDIDLDSTTPTTSTAEASEGSGIIQEFIDFDLELLDRDQTRKTVTRSPTIRTSSPSSSGPASLTISNTAGTVGSTSTRTTAKSKPTTLPTSLSSSTITSAVPRTFQQPSPTPLQTTSTIRRKISNGNFVASRANQELVDAIYPNKTAPCVLPDRSYCNQPISGNVSLMFSREDCAGNPFFCPGLCGLCTVVTCKDYSNQFYSPGQTWYSNYARLTCTSGGVVAKRGCFYEQLRKFIEAGETLHHEDGFLVYDCTCDVALQNDIWSHDLECHRSVSSEQKITVAPQKGECTTLDDHRCTDPYYTITDCTSIQVASICGAMCGKCIATQCQDSAGRVHAVGESWITGNGKLVCTEKGVTTLRGCRFTQRNTFIEVGGNYTYNQSGAEYYCKCDQLSEYRYQLSCEGQRKKSRLSVTTLRPDLSTEVVYPCRRVDNPKCGQLSSEFWTDELCTSSSVGWRSFMARVCPALCGLCQASQCRGYDGKVYAIGDKWLSSNTLHTCTVTGIRQL